ncbi:hypothetical protein BCR35DRAFT_303234 [Leucosporidium creatinivorum]|uniref:GAF domain-containing protein n=1 Tax=Leucosporidium creatinivorum TaxID=106004 RepID=A0A1Y2FJK4_9BASI|nr:hypothetical protein BCR35DRAFT_303234 [Leucosporidium creatinivorum]
MLHLSSRSHEPPSSPISSPPASPRAERVRELFSSVRRSMSGSRKGSHYLPPSPLSSPPSPRTVPLPLPSPVLPLTPTSPQQDWTPLPPAQRQQESWEGWYSAYQSGHLDFDRAPPPSRLAGPPPSSLFSGAGNLIAPEPQPYPGYEQHRSRAVKRLNIGRGSGPIASSGCFSTGSTDPRAHPINPALQKLVCEASERFKVAAAAVTLMYEGEQHFLAEIGFGGAEVITRETALCSHTVLKAANGAKDPFVVLSLGDDWRFNGNNWPQYGAGFYAGVCILLPSDASAPDELFPAGIFAIIDDDPRTDFSKSDQAALTALARRAAVELLSWQALNERERRLELAKRQQTFRKNRRVSEDRVTTLETVTEGCALQRESSEEQVKWEMEALARQGRRPSMAPSVDSLPTSELARTEISPLQCRRPSLGSIPFATGSKFYTVAAPPCTGLPEALKSCFDISTKLVGESLRLDFTALIAINLPSSFPPPAEHSTALHLLSHHNLPIPAPLFDLDAHLALFAPSHEASAVLYSNTHSSSRPAPNEFASGLMLKIGASPARGRGGEVMGYLLVGYVQDRSRAFTLEDLSFLLQFATDLARATEKL